MFFLVIFYWSAMDAYGHSKREVLEIFNINKNNGIGRYLFWNRQPIGQWFAIFSKLVTWHIMWLIYTIFIL